MITFAYVMLGFTAGWFACVSLGAAIERIYDWRPSAAYMSLALLLAATLAWYQHTS